MKKEEKDHEGEINLHKNGTKNFEDNKNYSEAEQSLDLMPEDGEFGPSDFYNSILGKYLNLP